MIQPRNVIHVVALALTLLSAQGLSADETRPNFIVIVVDDLRWDEIGCMEHPFVQTPHIDRIAAEGARFLNAFCTTPLCSPVRASLLTGLYTHHHGILDNTNRSEASHELPTFPRALQQSGYETAFIGKWHMGNDDTPRPGFDYWVGLPGQGTSFDPELNVDGERSRFEGHTTDVLNEKSAAFVRRPRDKPFCLYIAHKALHPELVQRDDGSITDPGASKFLPTKRHSDLYADATIPRRRNVTDSLEGKPALKRDIEGLPPLSRETGTSDETIRDRLRMLAGVDDGVGMLFEALTETDELDNTVIMFLSDHGYWYGEHGLSVERRLAYEEGIRIPLLVRYPPWVTPGRVIDELSLSIDLAPTLLEMANVEAPGLMDGASLVPLLEGHTPDNWRDAFLIEYNTDTVFPRVLNMGYRAIRTDRWKYIRYNDLNGVDELYDLQLDPYEMHNRIDDPDAQQALLQLRPWLAKLADDPLGVLYEENVPVPMRDGVILRANVHRPDRGGPYPVLVMRTPYGKGGRGRFDRHVKAGYIVVAQDARGRYESDGKWESFVRFDTHDAEDGYDTVEWAAKLPGSTGKVGTFGASYNAFLQWRTASLAPPSLVAMSAHSIPARYTDLEGPGTIRPGRRLNWWIVGMTHDMRKRNGNPGTLSRAEAQQKWSNGDADKWLHFLPYLDLPQSVFEDETNAVRNWLARPYTDPWKLDEGVSTITVPNLNVVGWWDHCNGDLRLDKTIRTDAATETARDGSRTIVGPWAHVGMGGRKYGNVDFGPNAVVDLAAEEIRWFDYWLKGRENGVPDIAPYRIFVMGDNQWRDEPTWPLERARDKILYLSSGGNANTPTGDGRLVDAADSGGTNQFAYAPENPVPSLHGPALFQIPTDQRPLADRSDILVYQTEPLTERIEVTGNSVVELHAATSAPDTDFFVRLIDVHPDGMARDVSLGMVRTRYRNGLDNPQLVTPGEVVRYTIRMNPTSNAFLPGHRIRLDITSSDFPNYDRNHNTAADQNADAELKTAEQTIHHGGAHATRIILPWIVAQPQQQ